MFSVRSNRGENDIFYARDRGVQYNTLTTRINITVIFAVQSVSCAGYILVMK